MRNGNRIETVDGEIFFPEAIVQHIQSFLRHKEATRTAILSKYWYNAWLTRPTLCFDQSDLKNYDKSPFDTDELMEFAAKTIQRYRDMNLKIDSFLLRTSSYRTDVSFLASNLIVDALKIGATDLNIDLHQPCSIIPPPLKPIRSKTLVKLHLSGCYIAGSVSCLRLKSLSLEGVYIQSDEVIRDMVSGCISIEELSFSDCFLSNSRDADFKSRLMMSGLNLRELHKLRHLFLERVQVDSLFLSDLSRFQSLKDLSLVSSSCYTAMKIASTSLECIKLVDVYISDPPRTAMFDVPNIRVFCYTGKGFPSLSIKADASKEWESHLSLVWYTCPQIALWFRRLIDLLKNLSPSRINLSLYLFSQMSFEEPGNFGLLPEPATLESLSVQSPNAASLLFRSLRVCRPKFITHSWIPASRDKYESCSLDSLCRVLMHQAIGPNCFIPDPNICGMFSLMEVKVEVYQPIPTEWHPRERERRRDSLTLANNEKIRFQLRWGKMR